MFKKIALTVAALSVATMALPVSLQDITGYAGTQNYNDTKAEYGELTDTDGNNDDATAFLFFEIADYKDGNQFGIYEFSYDVLGNVSIGDKLLVFDGPESPVTSTTVEFDLANGTATAKGVTKNIDKSFGFYIHVGATNNTYFSHAAANLDGFDHFMTFNTSDNSVGSLFGSDAVIAVEDLPNGGDEDFTDMVIGMSDVSVVPEPATIGLLGFGLMGLLAFRRKK